MIEKIINKFYETIKKAIVTIELLDVKSYIGYFYVVQKK